MAFGAFAFAYVVSVVVAFAAGAVACCLLGLPALVAISAITVAWASACVSAAVVPVIVLLAHVVAYAAEVALVALIAGAALLAVSFAVSQCLKDKRASSAIADAAAAAAADDAVGARCPYVPRALRTADRRVFRDGAGLLSVVGSRAVSLQGAQGASAWSHAAARTAAPTSKPLVVQRGLLLSQSQPQPQPQTKRNGPAGTSATPGVRTTGADASEAQRQSSASSPSRGVPVRQTQGADESTIPQPLSSFGMDAPHFDLNSAQAATQPFCTGPPKLLSDPSPFVAPVLGAGMNIDKKPRQEWTWERPQQPQEMQQAVQAAELGPSVEERRERRRAARQAVLAALERESQLFKGPMALKVLRPPRRPGLAPWAEPPAATVIAVPLRRRSPPPGVVAAAPEALEKHPAFVAPPVVEPHAQPVPMAEEAPQPKSPVAPAPVPVSAEQLSQVDQAPQPATRTTRPKSPERHDKDTEQRPAKKHHSLCSCRPCTRARKEQAKKLQEATQSQVAPGTGSGAQSEVASASEATQRKQPQQEAREGAGEGVVPKVERRTAPEIKFTPEPEAAESREAREDENKVDKAPLSVPEGAAVEDVSPAIAQRVETETAHATPSRSEPQELSAAVEVGPKENGSTAPQEEVAGHPSVNKEPQPEVAAPPSELSQPAPEVAAQKESTAIPFPEPVAQVSPPSKAEGPTTPSSLASELPETRAAAPTAAAIERAISPKEKTIDTAPQAAEAGPSPAKEPQAASIIPEAVAAAAPPSQPPAPVWTAEGAQQVPAGASPEWSLLESQFAPSSSLPLTALAMGAILEEEGHAEPLSAYSGPVQQQQPSAPVASTWGMAPESAWEPPAPPSSSTQWGSFLGTGLPSDVMSLLDSSSWTAMAAQSSGAAQPAASASQAQEGGGGAGLAQGPQSTASSGPAEQKTEQQVPVSAPAKQQQQQQQQQEAPGQAVVEPEQQKAAAAPAPQQQTETAAAKRELERAPDDEPQARRPRLSEPAPPVADAPAPTAAVAAAAAPVAEVPAAAATQTPAEAAGPVSKMDPDHPDWTPQKCLPPSKRSKVPWGSVTRPRRPRSPRSPVEEAASPVVLTPMTPSPLSSEDEGEAPVSSPRSPGQSAAQQAQPPSAAQDPTRAVPVVTDRDFEAMAARVSELLAGSKDQEKRSKA
eukprot:m51a1_g5128 hypothetical protein (1162) ;mRNA; f:398263-402793